jgi:radical SAM family uncharacterized protein/radical SAM-linked protein
VKKEISQFLNLVSRPSRYINNELNSHPADMEANFSICLCFPDVYEVGASNLGVEILYHLINEKKLARCERCFAPDTDMEEILRERNLDLFSLESNSGLKTFDIVGFSIQCELTATNIVNMLDLSKITCFAKVRKEKEPLIIGGGPALTNPEPFCDFFDLFVLGDGEEAIEDIINLCKEFKGKISRKELLRKLSDIEGVYVPSLYDVLYNDDNTIKSVRPIDESVKSVINKRVLDLSKSYFPSKKIVPFAETVHNRLNIEVARGCPGLCRFCQASKYYRPWRQRPIETLLQLVKSGIEATGYEEIAFSSLSCSDYQNLDKLLIETNKLYGDSKLNISLPSLRCNERSIHIAQYINRSKRPTLTFAPEAGTDRLRNVIGKYISEKQIVNTLLSANKMGWETVKLYFMISLPTETQEDIEAIDKLLRLVKENAKSLNFTITVSPFVPKSQTAFQWHSMLDSEKIKEKIDWLKSNVNADIKAHNHAASVFEAFIAKGDRRISATIYKAWQKGAKFDQWADKFNADIWNEALKESGIDLNFYVYRERKADEIFAWDHLNFGASKKDLYEQFIKGINEKADADTSAFSQKESALPSLPQDYTEPKLEYIEPQMRIRMRFSKKGSARFISHLEHIEVLRRAVRRAGLPLAFSGGFSPQVKASYTQPVSTGQESLSEYMELFLLKKVEINTIRETVSKALPNGYELLAVKRVPLLFPSLDSLISAMEFRILNTGLTKVELRTFLAQDKIIYLKEKKGQIKEIDLKAFIKSMRFETNALILLLKFDRGVFVKPEMVLGAIFKNSKWRDLIIERSNIYIETTDGALHTP